jgi:hypothetical protein
VKGEYFCGGGWTRFADEANHLGETDGRACPGRGRAPRKISGREFDIPNHPDALAFSRVQVYFAVAPTITSIAPFTIASSYGSV